jgi:plasmid stability protein
MADIALQLDDALLERLRTVALTRGCSMEALIAQLLHEFLPPATSVQAPDAIGLTATHWNPEEAEFLHKAVRALDEVPAGTPLPTSGATEWKKPG